MTVFYGFISAMQATAFWSAEFSALKFEHFLPVALEQPFAPITYTTYFSTLLCRAGEPSTR